LSWTLSLLGESCVVESECHVACEMNVWLVDVLERVTFAIEVG
jgi:hypothetical protein